MYLEFSEEHRMMRDTIRRFLEKELVPIVERIDEEEFFPMDILKKMGRMGFIGPHLPVEYGGSGGDFVGSCIILEEIAKISAGVECSVAMNGVVYANPIYKFGTDEQKQKYLPEVLAGEMTEGSIQEIQDL